MGISEKVDELYEQYGGYDKIPDRALYDLIYEGKSDLINVAKLGSEHISNTNLGKEIRRRCVSDIKWLAKYFLWDVISLSTTGEVGPVENNIFLDSTYDVVFDMFVQKDPKVPIHKLSPIKTRVLLWPRGCAKSWSDHIDTVQWVITYPFIRILYLTAEASLSSGFVSEVKAFFTLREDEPTMMNLFWPEMCCLEKDMRKGSVFTSPEWSRKKVKRKEATVTASSVGKTKSGQHYEVIKADDAVSDKNSETDTQCVSVSEKLDLVENLLVPGGDGYFLQFVGTRYHELDHYGKLVDKFQTNGEIEVVQAGVNWKRLHNKTFNVDIVIGKACQIKEDVAKLLAEQGRPVTYQEAGEDGCTLLVPNLISYSFFVGKFTKNERVTECQLNQNPRIASQKGFNRVSLIKATVPFNMLPRLGPVSQFWDLSFSQKKGTDFCVGSSVMWGEEDVYDAQGKRTGGRRTVGYVRKIVRDRFNPFTAAKAIVDLVREEKPFILGIEDAGGSKSLYPTIQAEAYKTGDQQVIAVCTHIDWVTPSNQFDAKHIRMGSLIPWVEEGRLKFANFALQPKYDSMDVLYDEFERCLFTRRHGQSTHHHDDIPDNLGYQPMYAPQAVQAITENNVGMFFFVDRQGWGEIYDESYRAQLGPTYVREEDGTITPMGGSQFGTSYYINDSGDVVPIGEPEPASIFPTMFQEPEHRYTPRGMDNILGSGLFG